MRETRAATRDQINVAGHIELPDFYFFHPAVLDFPLHAHARHDGHAHAHLHEALDAFDGRHLDGHVELGVIAHEKFYDAASEGRFDDVGDEILGAQVGEIGSPTLGEAMFGRNDEGELIVRNPGILLGYHNLPDETSKRIRDGWYYTGDICRRDAEGFYYFVGRTDDMFVSGGENIFPIEVETLLERHPAVHQAYVMPFDHDMKGQVPYAFVVLRAGARATEDDLKQFALANGPAYQHPRRVYFLDQLPLAGTNKIDQARLRQWVADGTLEHEQNRSTT